MKMKKIYLPLVLLLLLVSYVNSDKLSLNAEKLPSDSYEIPVCQVDMPEVSYSDAIQVYNEAQNLSEQGDTRAQEVYRRAFGMFLAVSLGGNADAQFYLAYCYSNGLGVEVDNDKAAEWYRRSAEQGNSSSQNNLGVCYSNGRGVNQDKAKAAECIADVLLRKRA